MRRLVVPAIIENLYDLLDMRHGRRRIPRRIEVAAIVDVDTRIMSLSAGQIERLGLERSETWPPQVVSYGPVNLCVMGRNATLTVTVAPDDQETRLGYLALRQLDLVVDGDNERLIGDPFHQGTDLIDLF